MAPPINLVTGAIGIRQPEPPEGRKMFPLFGPPIIFTTGAEIYQWNSQSLGAAAPSGIMGAWVDASAVPLGANNPTTNFLYIDVNGGAVAGGQTFVVPAGSQGYIIITAQMPVTIAIRTNAGAGPYKVVVTLYNYNPLFTGSIATNSAAPAPPGSGSGSGIGGPGGQSGSGGRWLIGGGPNPA